MKPAARCCWNRKKVLITSGPTREYLDPVRYLTNSSSGKMGRALAIEAKRLGARVELVSGPTGLKDPRGVRTIHVVTALEMRRVVMRLFRRADVIIGAAAVGDWRVSRSSNHKIKRKGLLRLTLIPNPDIIKEVGLKRRLGRRQIVVGFALETRNRLAEARKKLIKKGLDLIVANGPENIGSGRASLTLLGRDGVPVVIGTRSKSAAARAILRRVLVMLK